MSWLVSFRECDDEYERRRKREWFFIFSVVFVVLAFWNPATRPGPVLCLLRNGVGLPCPLCGCTRGVALGLRGDWFGASTYNPLAIPALFVLVFLWLKYGIELAFRRRLEFFGGVGIGWAQRWLVPVAMGAAWVYLLMYRREDTFAESWLGSLWRLVMG